MKKNKIYRYLGRNGMITTPVLLEGVTPIIMYRLIADNNKILTTGTIKTTQVDVFEDELNDWHEINNDGQN